MNFFRKHFRLEDNRSEESPQVQLHRKIIEDYEIRLKTMEELEGNDYQGAKELIKGKIKEHKEKLARAMKEGKN